MSDEKRALVAPTIRERYEGVPYGWCPALLKGFRILIVRDWPYFRWTFLLDAILALCFMDLLLLPIFRYLKLSWLGLVYLFVIAANYVLWKVKPLKFSETTVKPSELLSILRAQGATLMFDAYAIQLQKKASAK